MGTAWGPGRYGTDITQPGQSGAAGGTSGQPCDCHDACCVPTQEVHYQALSSNTSASLTPIDANKTPSLTSRLTMEFYNAGSVAFEISTIQNFNYGDGQGRPVAAGSSFSVAIDGKTRHYMACASTGCDCRITELGR